jgi:hypothetical protein
VTAYLIAPGQDAIESALGDDTKVSFSTKRFKALIGLTDQANQEVVFAVAEVARKRLAQSLATATEKAIIRGDTGISDANDVRKAFDGLIKYAKDAGNVVDAGGGAVTAQLIHSARRKLGVYGTDVMDLAILAPVSVGYQMVALPEVMTLDKFGPQATIKTGSLAKIWGVDIIPTEHIPENLQADLTDDEQGDKTALLIVNTKYFMLADRGRVKFEKDRNVVSSTDIHVGYRDVDFKKIAINFTPVAAISNVDPNA